MSLWSDLRIYLYALKIGEPCNVYKGSLVIFELVSQSRGKDPKWIVWAEGGGHWNENGAILHYDHSLSLFHLPSQIWVKQIRFPSLQEFGRSINSSSADPILSGLLRKASQVVVSFIQVFFSSHLVTLHFLDLVSLRHGFVSSIFLFSKWFSFQLFFSSCWIYSNSAHFILVLSVICWCLGLSRLSTDNSKLLHGLLFCWCYNS